MEKPTTASQHELHDLFFYQNGSLINKADRSATSRAGKPAGGHDGRGYLRAMVGRRMYKMHQLVWIYHHGSLPSVGVIDHINRDKTDNRIENLRIIDAAFNSVNSNQRKETFSGVQGVGYGTKAEIFVTAIYRNKKSVVVYRGKDLTEAVAHRLAVEQCLGYDDYCDMTPAAKYMANYLTNHLEG